MGRPIAAAPLDSRSKSNSFASLTDKDRRVVVKTELHGHPGSVVSVTRGSKIRKCIRLGHYTHHLDVDGADFFLQTEIIAVNPGDFFGEVALNRIQLGVRTHFEPQRGAKFSASSFHLRARRGDASQLLATRLEKPMQGMPGNLEPPAFVRGQNESAGLPHVEEQHEQREPSPENDPLYGRLREVFKKG